jgi:hypothetical protein
VQLSVVFPIIVQVVVIVVFVEKLAEPEVLLDEEFTVQPVHKVAEILW